MDPHGKWRKGCKCEACRTALAAYAREYRQRPEAKAARRELRARQRAVRKAEGLSAAPWDDARKAVYQKRRAAKRGAAAESFKPSEVFDRDGWSCAICGSAIDPELTYPAPRSVSLDHLIPLSVGGEHTRANTRAAHLECNVRRGNRAEVA